MENIICYKLSEKKCLTYLKMRATMELTRVHNIFGRNVFKAMNNVFYPVIGIRPTIDGRRNGVREALEDKTMNMATAVSNLIESTLRYPDGKPVKTLIPKQAIGGVAEAHACAKLFSEKNVCASITVTPSWCYGTETLDMEPLTPKAIWGFNGTERQALSIWLVLHPPATNLEYPYLKYTDTTFKTCVTIAYLQMWQLIFYASPRQQSLLGG